MTAIEQRQFSRWAEGNVRAWLTALDYDRLVDGPALLPVVERFDWQGRALNPAFRRVRVIGRQSYVLCHAALGRREGTRRLAELAVTSLIERGMGRDGQFYCRLARDGSVLEAAPDLYDIAFGLFALAWWYRLSGDERAITVAERSLAHLRSELASPSGEGFLSRVGEATGHEQNPHMHLFEAATFLAAFTGRPLFRDFADELFELFETRLFVRATGLLPENFDLAWCPTGNGGALRIEPGHHYEWVWLLHRYARLARQPRAYALAEQLFDFADRFGHDETTGLVLDAIDRRGRPVDVDLRLWPNTELLKAQIAMQERYGQEPGFDDAAIMNNVQRIRDNFLTRQITGPAAMLREGWWIDHLEASGLRPKCDHIPASSLYHIFFAFTELLRHRAGHDPFSGLPW